MMTLLLESLFKSIFADFAFVNKSLLSTDFLVISSSSDNHFRQLHQKIGSTKGCHLDGGQSSALSRIGYSLDASKKSLHIFLALGFVLVKIGSRAVFPIRRSAKLWC